MVANAQIVPVDRSMYWATYPEDTIQPDGFPIAQSVVRGSGVQFSPTATPDRAFIYLSFDTTTGLIARNRIPSAAVGTAVTLDNAEVFLDGTVDTDADGLAAVEEFVVGTSATDADSDDDGTRDGEEIDLRTNPLDGVALPIGVVAAFATPAPAVDVDARDNLLAVALGNAGIVVASIFNGLNPKIVSAVDAANTATAVAIEGNRVAVADGVAGLTIIDVGDPNRAFTLTTLFVPGITNAVAAKGQRAYAGSSTGAIVVADLATGERLQARDLPASGPIHDLQVGANVLYALASTGVHSIALYNGRLGAGAFLPIAGLIPGSPSTRLRMFWAESRLYVVRRNGYIVLSLANPLAPSIVNQLSSARTSWKHLVDNGAGLALAAVAPASAGPHDVSLYDTSLDANNNTLIADLGTPGTAFAVALYNALGYVADGASGVQVVNYLPLDTGSQPPTVSVSSSAIAGQVVEGQLLRVAALADDDFQVKVVEFFANDQLAATDGNFPFDHVLVAPTMAQAGGTALRIRARAVDTGGREAFSNELMLTLMPDNGPPMVVAVAPPDSAILYDPPDAVNVVFSEAIDPASLNLVDFRVLNIGRDGVPGGGDDGGQVPATLGYRTELQTAVYDPTEATPPSVYRVEVESVNDNAGNQQVGTFVSQFRVLDLGTDNDMDGLPNDVETFLTGTNPLVPDTDGDKDGDGDEDNDGDGLGNFCEYRARLRIDVADTDGDGILDGADDADGDGLSNVDECNANTDLLRADTDGDGFNDESEITAGSDPRDPLSTPGTTGVVALPIADNVGVVRLDDAPGALPFGTYAASPIADNAGVVRLDEAPGAFVFGTYAARPIGDDVGVVRLATDVLQGVRNTTKAKPPVQVIWQ